MTPKARKTEQYVGFLKINLECVMKCGIGMFPSFKIQIQLNMHKKIHHMYVQTYDVDKIIKSIAHDQ